MVSSGMAHISIPALGLEGDTDTGQLTGPPGASPWPALIRWLLATDEMSSGVLARRLGANDRTVRRWLSGDYPPLPRERRLLLALARETLLSGPRPQGRSPHD